MEYTSAMENSGRTLSRRALLRGAAAAAAGGAALAVGALPALAAPQTDAQFLQAAIDAGKRRTQPTAGGSCLVYARTLGAPAASLKSNLGAFNLLFVGNDAKLKNLNPTATRKSLRTLSGVTNFTSVLRAGDFIVWDRGNSTNRNGADSTYGHIAVVERVEAGRLVISQAGWSPTWRLMKTGAFASGIYAYPKGTP